MFYMYCSVEFFSVTVTLSRILAEQGVLLDLIMVFSRKFVYCGRLLLNSVLTLFRKKPMGRSMGRIRLPADQKDYRENHRFPILLGKDDS